jgi:hypothetical protein
MFARTACRIRASGFSGCSVSNGPPTDGRMRTTIERRFGDRLSLARSSSFRVTITAPHMEWPKTTTSRVPNLSVANSAFVAQID